MLSNKNINRYKQLAGILPEGVRLVPDNSGRSDKNTLSFYIEEYLLNVASIIITQLDNTLSQNGFLLAISQSNTKMQENSFATKLIINSSDKKSQPKEYILTGMVNFEEGGNTAFSISHNGLTNKFNLNSKHTGNDIGLFSKEILTYFLNSTKI